MSIEEILLFLNTLLYSDLFDDSTKGKSIYDLVKKDELPSPGNPFVPNETQWQMMLGTILANRHIFENIVVEDIEYTKDAQVNVAFTNIATGELYIVYKGTGAVEWLDNADGGSVLVPTTEQQQNALAFA